MKILRSATAKFAFLALPLSLAACGNAPDTVTNMAQSGSNPDKHGFTQFDDEGPVSQQKLAATIAPLFDDADKSETRAVLILYKGKVIAERYSPDYGPETRFISWSMAKSITGIVLGMMVADGRLTLDEPAAVSEWQSPGDPRGKITLRHLLNMESGIQHKEGAESDSPIYAADTPRMLFLDGRENVARFAEGHPMEAPIGKQFEYSTATTHIIDDIMTRSLTDSKNPEIRRDAMLEYLRGRLFEPLGMSSAFAEFDRSGNILGGSMIHANARDWGKFGEFLRNNGSVRGAQLLPAKWINFMRTSSPNDPAYGGHLWLNKPRPDGRDVILFPGNAPSDVFAATGHLGQFVIVSPQHQLTIVRLGKTQDDDLRPVYDQLAKLIRQFPILG
jgi:CubicO group peptidase (beta-lactamase class C family)